jgi:tripartite-type tricarboxylate transporter receptor subunit TctC
VACVLGALAMPQAAAQDYPSRPIRMINTTTAGGPAELVARLIGQKLTEAWGQQVVVDTRTGAAGMIGGELVARASPDGYTLLLGSGASMVVAPLVHKAAPYHPLRDFAHVSMAVISPFALVAHPSVGAKTLPELVAAAKARPGAFNFGSTGTGSTSHLGGEQLRMLAGIDIRHVPYKGAVPAVADLVAGQIHVLFNSMATALPHVKTGRLSLVANGGAKRSPLIPDTPTLAETYPGFEVVTWYSVAAPAKTPRSIVRKLNAGIGSALASPDTLARLATLGHEPHPSTPEAMFEYTRSEMEKWSRIIKAVGVKGDS